MKWDQQLIKACTETDGTPHPHTDHVLTGAKWQRDQLRTDEAVERMARAICLASRGLPVGLSFNLDGVEDAAVHRAEARAAITALLGDSDND